MEHIILLLAAYGLCFGLMNDKAKWVTNPLRRIPLFKKEELTWFDRLLICPYCTGFHAGWLVWLAAAAPFDDMVAVDVVEAVLFAFASSAFCYAVDSVVQWFER